eukprot:11466922-Karenia_brevis.AAC.1
MMPGWEAGEKGHVLSPGSEDLLSRLPVKSPCGAINGKASLSVQARESNMTMLLQHPSKFSCGVGGDS